MRPPFSLQRVRYPNVFSLGDVGGMPNSKTPSFPLDPTKERWSMQFDRRKILPSLYWNRMQAGAGHERQFVPGNH